MKFGFLPYFYEGSCALELEGVEVQTIKSGVVVLYEQFLYVVAVKTNFSVLDLRRFWYDVKHIVN